MQRSKLTWAQIEKRSIKVLCEQLGVDRSKVALNSRFIEDLEADSLDMVEVKYAFEEEFAFEIPDEIEDLQSLAHAFEYFATNETRRLFDLIQPRVLAFRILANGTVEVSLRTEDGSWLYSDGRRQLPNKLYIVQYVEWASILKELEELLNNPHTAERELQKYFERYPELLVGDEYDRLIPQATIVHNGKADPWSADFVLSPINQTEFSKIIELKLPKMQLTLKPNSGHVNFSSSLRKAIAQLKNYARALNQEKARKIFQEMYNTDVFLPDLQLIAGRKWDLMWIDEISALRKDSEVNIQTWDTLLESLRRRFT